MTILHNGKRYEQDYKTELTDDEVEKISLYIVLDNTEVEKKAQETTKKCGQDNKDTGEQ